jgi:hypothetical protein
MKADPRRSPEKPITHYPSPITWGRRAVLAAALLGCAGCGPTPWVAEGNYLTYDHPFSDASAAAVRKNAEGRCRQRDQAAVETSRACSLTQCTTSYQCMDEVDARRLAGEKK